MQRLGHEKPRATGVRVPQLFDRQSAVSPRELGGVSHAHCLVAQHECDRAAKLPRVFEVRPFFFEQRILGLLEKKSTRKKDVNADACRRKNANVNSMRADG